MTTFVPAVPPAVAGLAPFVAAGLFGPGEVHLAATIARLAPTTHPDVLLAAAVAARAPRLGHVGIELAHVARRMLDRRDEALPDLPWPEVSTWAGRLADSPVVAGPADHDAEPLAPLVWDGERIYPHRYWTYELQVAADLRARSEGPGAPVELTGPLAAALDALFPHPPDVTGGATEVGPDLQLQAARVALGNRLSVVAGGPGTGKTRTIARLLAAAARAAAEEGRGLEVALAAPTGKAASRMTEAVHQAVAEARDDGVLDAGAAADLGALEATTIHALLGWVPGVRFRRDRQDPLPHDLVIVDETSMVSLPLMARLLSAVRPDASLVLVGDPDQLASVDAGTVLADLVGTGSDPNGSFGARLSGELPPPSPRARRRGAVAASTAPDGGEPRLFDVEAFAVEVPGPTTAGSMATAASTAAETTVADGRDVVAPLAGRVTVLHRVHRFGAESGIAALADAIRRGDVDDALDLLRGDRHDASWVVPTDGFALARVEAEVTAAAVDVIGAARAGDALAGLEAVSRVKVLAAPRHGDNGLYRWTARIEAAVRAAVPDLDIGLRWYAGRPVLVTANDRVNKLANGDVGLVVARDGGTIVALAQGGDVRYVPVSRLHDAETWWAMTIHKSQGSEFPHAVVALPQATSPILTRELLYTAVTRAKERVTVVADEAALRTAIASPVARASGLGARLWPSR